MTGAGPGDGMRRAWHARLTELRSLAGCLVAGSLGMSLMAACAAQPAAHSHAKRQLPHKLIDLGTFGGPSSFLDLPGVPITGNGTVLGAADTAVSDADWGPHCPVSFFRFQPPERPVHVTATAARGQVKLAWHAPRDGGLPVIYRIIPAPACPACHGLTTVPTSGIPATTVTGLTQGQRYTFTVTATDAAGTGPASAPSNPIIP
jgi:hypothetical protein